MDEERLTVALAAYLLVLVLIFMGGIRDGSTLLNVSLKTPHEECMMLINVFWSWPDNTPDPIMSYLLVNFFFKVSGRVFPKSADPFNCPKTSLFSNILL